MNLTKTFSALALAAFLAACSSTEDRIAEHYDNGIELLEAGDLDRAVIEFRNVLKLQGDHKEAREALAEALLQRGDVRKSYSQYLRVAEQYPDDLGTRITLARMAFQSRNWDELTRHATRAGELDPESRDVKIVTLAKSYAEVTRNTDLSGLAPLAAQAQALFDQEADPILRQILIDDSSRKEEFGTVLSLLDDALAADPQDRVLYVQRLSVLSRLGDDAGIEAQMRQMIETFPEDETVKASLIRYYMSRERNDEAEEFLRSISSPSDDPPANFLALVQFLIRTDQVDRAREEIARGISENPHGNLFRALDAELEFQIGDREKAVADLEAVIEGSDDPSQARNLKIIAARMYTTQGNEVAARKAVEEILSEDPEQPDALKMQANWLIQDDRPDAAIANLRQVIDGDGQDADAMTLMSQAYTRDGSHDLARDYLALAVEASGNAPAETLRYARRLMSEERFLPAEDVLIASLRLQPNNPQLLATLGEVYVALDDAPRTRQVIDTLRRLDTPEASGQADQFEAALIRKQNGAEQALNFLQGVAGDQEGGLGAQLSLLRAQVAAGEMDKASALIERLVAENPDNPNLRYARAAVAGAQGELETAEDDYRALVEEDPKRGAVWLQLVRVLRAQGESQRARAALEEALVENPEDGNLLWANAGYLEQDGDPEAAIAIYEQLYEQNSDSVLVANNLASMLATYRDDPESLDRAYRVSRRLNGTDVPAFQDTYGWVSHRKGNSAEGLPYLESASQALIEDPIVQYHLGVVYEALGRPADALRQMQRSVDSAGPADTRKDVEAARAAIARLQEAVAAQGE